MIIGMKQQLHDLLINSLYSLIHPLWLATLVLSVEGALCVIFSIILSHMPHK